MRRGKVVTSQIILEGVQEEEGISGHIHKTKLMGNGAHFPQVSSLYLPLPSVTSVLLWVVVITFVSCTRQGVS